MRDRRFALFAAVLFAVLAADQATKAIVRHALGAYGQVTVIPGALWFTHVQNPGAAFGVLGGKRWLFVLISAAVLAGIILVVALFKPRSVLLTCALGLVGGGALGNLIDRIVSGTVTDFFDLGWFPVFNIADAALDVGVALVVWWLLFAAEAREQ